MMCYPSIDSLVKKVDSKYTLVTLAALRARELTDGQTPLMQKARNQRPSLLKRSMKARSPTPSANKNKVRQSKKGCLTFCTFRVTGDLQTNFLASPSMYLRRSRHLNPLNPEPSIHFLVKELMHDV